MRFVSRKMGGSDTHAAALPKRHLPHHVPTAELPRQRTPGHRLPELEVEAQRLRASEFRPRRFSGAHAREDVGFHRRLRDAQPVRSPPVFIVAGNHLLLT